MTTECRFLGVIIDDKLNFSKHISFISGKISRSTGILYRIKSMLPMRKRLDFYYNFVYPYLSYGIVVWGATYDVHLNNIVVLHKRIIRILTDSPYDAHTTPLFRRLKLLKLKDIYRYSILVYMYQNHMNDEFRVRHERNTRFSSSTLPSFNRLTLCQHCITYTGPSYWNDLPSSLRESRSLKTFKANLKKEILGNYT